MQNRIRAIEAHGWKKHPYGCAGSNVDAADIGRLHGNVPGRLRHFRGLYIHGHLDDPPVGYTFFKNLDLPKWWFVMPKQNKEVNV